MNTDMRLQDGIRLRATLEEQRRDLGLQVIHGRVAVAAALEPAHRQAAMQLVSAGYATLAGADLTPGEVAGDLYSLRSEDPSRALCVVAQVSEVVLATATLSLPDTDQDITEALRLFHSPRPWDEVFGTRAHRVGEMGRFAMAPLLQRSENRKLAVAILRELVTLMLGYARDAGLQRVVAIMPLSTLRMTAQTGLRFHPVTDATLAVGDPHHIHIFQKYPRYWMPDNEKLRPRLYWFEWPTETGSESSHAETVHESIN